MNDVSRGGMSDDATRGHIHIRSVDADTSPRALCGVTSWTANWARHDRPATCRTCLSLDQDR